MEWQPFSDDQMDFRACIELYSDYHTYLPHSCTGMNLGTLGSQSENTNFMPPRLILTPPFQLPVPVVWQQVCII
jgi:hypothetical protein